MKTLYMRFVATTIFIMLLSGLISFLLSNLYYQIKLKPYNNEKITRMAKNVTSFYQANSEVDLNQYLDSVANLGYQIALTDERKKLMTFGRPFNSTTLKPAAIDHVLRGQTYHGIAQYPKQIFVTGFFDDELSNTIGVPIDIKGKRHALFIRPDIEYLFGEMRVFFTVLVALTIGLSVAFVFAGTHYIVKPIRILTRATKIVAQGKYNLSLNVDHEDEIGQLARHFTHMAHSLQRLDEMRQEFVSNVSHEIQSPLASIQGFSKTLQSEEIPPAQQKHYLSIIEKESHRLSLLSKQLLTLASLDKEAGTLEKTTFDLADQIKQVLFMMEWQWRKKDLAIEMELPETFIQADPKLLHQVWINLLTNSIKFTERGGTITIKIDKTRKKEIAVMVQDTGIGIPEQDLPRIFDRFYKVDKARERNDHGSGLGLAIVYKIIEAHQGSIDVASQENKGTTFTIRLPQM
ncbi:sensor histidine kinase [Laceyella sacchari]|uniref:Heme sensor protein HssS n=1 Tax=Laceyella sacchari TaxID=37482 RepID=A0ABY5UA77_LACSH|nr:HAMP domain-containing sensor histidine kinase [Laceyella sacchari]UWE04983.1 HAMP domain-containing histidine kinase [Laceyella sacchari]